MRRRWTLLLAPLLALGVGCDGGDRSILVDLRTDLLPGQHFVTVRTVVTRQDGERAEPPTERQVQASAAHDFLDGRRIAELSQVESGTYNVHVSLIGLMGEVVAQRSTLVAVRGHHAVTVLITSSCQFVECPGVGDDPALTACVGGRCVDPRCSPQTPEFCGEGGCDSASECTGGVECTVPRCLDSECFQEPDTGLCEADMSCDPLLGCVIAPMEDGDAGPPCAASETSCTDGLDDDCDGNIDCADIDCLDAECDDGSVCTSGDSCLPDGTCGGDPLDCDDGNPCTDDGCDPASGCTNSANTAPCDDGFWCNGTDSCRDGACQDHADPPCTELCNEAAETCDECAADSDCGSVSYGSWGSCGYSGTCDESASRTRSVMTPRCSAGRCTVETSTQTGSCSRNTDGTRCGSTTYSSWGSCNWSDGCDQSAQRTRTRTERRCSSGSCRNRNFTETDGCSRTVSDGTSCGGAGYVCCSGSCVTVTSNTRCGGCTVNCSAIGRTCAHNGNGYACRGCVSNAECQSQLDGRATCWNVSSPPAYCQCQCASNGVCADGGCGPGFYCHDCSGHNFCSPNGGSC